MRRVTRLLDETVDARPLGIARIAIALAALIKGLVMSISLREFTTGDYVRFPYPVEVPSPGSETTVVAVMVLWTTLAVLFLFGFWSRLVGAALALTILYTISIDQQLYSNHLYLLATVTALLAIADSGARYSLDARRGSTSERVPYWPVLLLKLQVTSVYLFAAVTKINSSFLDGTVITIAFDPGMLEWVSGIVSVEVLAAASICTEIFLAVALWFSRTRWIAMTVALGFHVMNVLMMDRASALNLTVFGVMMIALILLFFSDQWKREEEALATEPGWHPAQPQTQVAGS